MTTVIVHHSVADFEAWKAVYDTHDGRQANGCTSASVYRSADDPLFVTVVTEFPSLVNARAFVNDPGLKEAMGKAGVTSAPDVRILDEVETNVGDDV